MDFTTLKEVFSIAKDLILIGCIVIPLYTLLRFEREIKELYRKTFDDFKEMNEHLLGLKNEELKDIEQKYEKVKALQKQTEDELEMEKGKFHGRRLFQYKGLYPIDIQKGNIPILNNKTYIEAVKHFLENEFDRLAVSDLVYLREDNRPKIDPLQSEKDFVLYNKLIEKYNLKDFINKFEEEHNLIFQNYKKIVDDIGDTFSNVCVEILVHNVRNPLRSIVAAKGTEKISGRKLYDPSTRFVVQFVKNQGEKLIQAMEERDKVSYLKQFNTNKKVKATTTPIYHEKYGLIGILCINIDIDAIKSMDNETKNEFFKNYISNSEITPDFEKEDWGLA